MKRQVERKCPVEDYGVEIAGEVLPGIYAHQQECAQTHGCVREICLLEGAWPEEIVGNQDVEDDTFSGTASTGYDVDGRSEVRSSWECLGSD